MGTQQQNGQQNQNDDQEHDDKGGDEKLTRAEVQKMIDQGVNGAMKSWGPRLTKGLATADDLTGIKTILEGLQTTKAQPGAGGQPAAGGQNQQTQADPEVAKLREQIEKLTKDNERERKEKAEQAARIDQEQRERSITDALRSKGVRNELVDAAAALLLVKRNVLKRNDSGELVYVVKRKDYEDELPVADGVEEFLKTDEGKAYLPPRDVGGTGEKGGHKVSTGKGGGVNLSFGEALAMAMSGGGPGVDE